MPAARRSGCRHLFSPDAALDVAGPTRRQLAAELLACIVVLDRKLNDSGR